MREQRKGTVQTNDGWRWAPPRPTRRLWHCSLFAKP